MPLIVEPSQAVKCNLFIYADTGLVSQHIDIIETEKQLNQDFERICDWFVNNKQSIHIGDGKTKSILFATKFKNKRSLKQNIKKDGTMQIKQHSKVRYLGYMLQLFTKYLRQTLVFMLNITLRKGFSYIFQEFLASTDGILILGGAMGSRLSLSEVLRVS